MKRFISVALIVTIVMSAFAVFAQDSSTVFTLSEAEGSCGEEVVVGVNVGGSHNIASFTVDIEYDPNALIPVKAEKTSLLDGQFVSNLEYDDNKIRIVYAAVRNIADEGEIVKLTFKINEHQKGDINASLKGSAVFVSDKEKNEIAGSVTDSHIYIKPNNSFVENNEKQILISDVECNAKEEVEVVVYTEEALDICSGSLTITYDSGIQIVKCEKGKLLNKLSVMINPENDKDRIRMNFLGVEPISEAGELLKITLLVKSNETKNYNITIKDATMFKLDETMVPIKADAGVIKVTETRSGSGGGSGGGGGSSVDEKEEAVKEEPTEIATETIVKEESKPYKNQFADVKATDWFYESVNYVAEKGIMNGVSETEFAPLLPVTRAMIVTMLYRLESEPDVKVCPFVDVNSDAWYYRGVAWASEKGVVNGIGNNMFAPDANVTREQIAVILYNYAKYKGADINLREELTAFSDNKNVSAWAKPQMEWAVASKLINGKGNMQLDAGGNATRAEIATILQRFIESTKK